MNGPCILNLNLALSRPSEEWILNVHSRLREIGYDLLKFENSPDGQKPHVTLARVDCSVASGFESIGQDSIDELVQAPKMVHFENLRLSPIKPIYVVASVRLKPRFVKILRNVTQKLGGDCTEIRDPLHVTVAAGMPQTVPSKISFGGDFHADPGFSALRLSRQGLMGSCTSTVRSISLEEAT